MLEKTMDETQDKNQLARTRSIRQNASGLVPVGDKSDSVDSGIEPQLDQENLIGTLFDNKYEILELLGRGGMGRVFKVRNRINGQIRALKVLHARLVSDADALRRFEQEATAASRIIHPNAIKTIDNGIDNSGNPYLVLEYIEGISLASMVRQSGPLKILTGVNIFTQICSALEEAHRNGVVHRDIKPSNILIVNSPNHKHFAKVLDFGIAKVLPRAEDGTIAVTATGEVFGSPPYMSPEQCLGSALDHRSDIYSLGCLMYEVLSGAPPFVGDNQLSTMYKQINEIAAPLNCPGEDVRLVEQLDRIVFMAMKKQPSERYASAAHLLNDLNSAFDRSSRRSFIVSALSLRMYGAIQAVANAIGSSRKALILIIAIVLATTIPLSLFIAPCVFVKIPDEAKSDLQWQLRPHLGISSPGSHERYIQREAKFKDGMNAPDISPVELTAKLLGLADMYFEDGFFNEAEVRYFQAYALRSKELRSKNLRPESIPIIMHDCAYALSRYSRCLIHLGGYKDALAQGHVGLHLAFYDTTKNYEYKYFFSQVIGVATVRVYQTSTPLTNEYFDKFIAALDLGNVSETAAELAQSLVEIGDCYSLTGQWERAISVYSKAKDLWRRLESPDTYNRATSLVGIKITQVTEKELRLLARRGDYAVYNEALADVKIAHANSKLGKFDFAKENLESAASGFEKWGGERCWPRINVLFQLANCYWNTHDYLKGWYAKANAVRSISK